MVNFWLALVVVIGAFALGFGVGIKFMTSVAARAIVDGKLDETVKKAAQVRKSRQEAPNA